MTAVLNRRTFMAAAGAGFAAGLGLPHRTALAGSDELFATAFMDRDGRYGVAVLTARGEIVSRETLPGRGHGFAASGRHVVAFARRPGLFAAVFERSGLKSPRIVASPAGRHFFGHGLFSPDGRLLYATENDFDGERGVIGVYDATDGFRRTGEFFSGGIDPHDMTLLGDGRVLCVANGGILTHPDYGRAKLNLATMEPAIAFIRVPEGDLLERQTLPARLSRLSLRHLAPDRRGRVWIGAQWEGDLAEEPPLAFRCAPGEPLAALPAPAGGWAGMRNYVGSVAASADGESIAFTAPQGNRMLIVDARTFTAAGWLEQDRVYGVAGSGTGFLTSTETGMAGGAVHELAWDNHMMRLP